MKIKEWDTILLSKTIPTLKEIGSLIQLARKRRKMSATELGQRVGVDRRTISQLENGHPGVSMGVFIQTLNVLSLIRGLTEALRPDNDIEAMTIEIRKARKRATPPKKISDDEVNF